MITGKLLNEILQLGAKQALYREDGVWYHNLTKFPGVLFDKNGYVIFSNEEEYSSDPNLVRQKDLHINGGLSSLDNYIYFGRLDSLYELYVEEKTHLKNNEREKALRALQEIERIIRSRKLVNDVKLLYNDTCQICDLRLDVGRNRYYSEVHHIRPLGKPHNGSDDWDNVICVCPNCHARLDRNAFSLNKESFVQSKHKISEKNIKYHNSLSCGTVKKS